MRSSSPMAASQILTTNNQPRRETPGTKGKQCMKRAQLNRQGTHARPLHKTVSPALVLSLAAIISIAAAPRRSLAGPAGYSFQAIAYLGDDAPGGARSSSATSSPRGS